MKKRNVMISIFFAGLLLMGIGSGVAFAEFSSFSYGGRKMINGEITSVTLEQTIPEQAETIRFFINGSSLGRIRLETDSSMEPDKISAEVLCNQQAISPYFREQETEQSKEAVYFIDYSYHDSYDEVSEFFQIKEEFLEGIKNRVIYSYSDDDIEEVIIKASPELMNRIIVE